MHRKIVGILLAGCMLIGLTGCGASKIEYDDVDSAKNAMNTASVIEMKFDSEQPNQESDVKADGKVAGFMKESGLLNTKWTVSIDKDTWFYMKFVTDEWINDVEETSGTVYGFYDEDDNCLGYARKQILDDGVDGREYYFVYLDEEGNPKDYYSDEHAFNLYDYEGNQIGEGDVEIKMFGSKHNVSVAMSDDTDIQVDFMDKLAMCIIMFSEYD